MKSALWTALFLSASSLLSQNLPAPTLPKVDAPVASQKSDKPSKSDEKKARHEFSAGMKDKKSGKLSEALSHFESATTLVPQNVDYATAREMTRQEAVLAAVQHGNQAMERNATIEAQADYREALKIDPANEFALQQLRNVLPAISPTSVAVRYSDGPDDNWRSPLDLAPEQVTKSFHYRGDSRGLITTVMQAYGVAATVDETVPTKRVRFDLDDTGFLQAMDAVTSVTKTFWVPLGLRQVLVMADTAANRRDNQKNTLRTFYFPDATTPTELQDMVNVFRTIFDVRFVVPQPSQNTIAVRAPQPTVAAITQFFDDLDGTRPQVSLDIAVYQVSGTLTRQLGIAPPQQFTTFNLGAALSQLGSTNIQTLINNLIASGAINQANGTSIQALLAQALGSQSSLFQNPFATYGGGLTLMALTIPGATLNINLNKSDLQSLDHLTIRASQNIASTVKIGERYPILNSTFSPIYNTAAISSVIGNGSYIAPFPSFNYEDLGLTVKATPSIQRNRDVRLNLEMQIRSLGASTNNGIPIINNEEYKGTISLKDGEPGVVVSYVTRSQSLSISGVPGAGQLPVLGSLLSSRDREGLESELMIIITPHVVKVADPKMDAIALPHGT
jgi:type II secretory pathway component GspD/PulD (secretin)